MLHYGHLQSDAIPEIATSTSLAVIVVILIVTTVASLLKARRDPEARAHAGSLRDSPPEATAPPTGRRVPERVGGRGDDSTR